VLSMMLKNFSIDLVLKSDFLNHSSDVFANAFPLRFAGINFSGNGFIALKTIADWQAFST
jgi:hypothetical protein